MVTENSNEENLLKVSYDYDKTVLFAVLGFLLTFSIAQAVSMQAPSMGWMQNMLAILVPVFFIEALYFAFRWHTSCVRLKKFYNNNLSK